MIDATVVVATFGSEQWRLLGNQAAKTAEETGAQVVRVHLPEGTLAQARNHGLDRVTTAHVVFLDGDDALPRDYFAGKMPDADVIATRICYGRRTLSMMPRVWTHERRTMGGKYHEPPCTAECLPDGNWVHVGAIMRTEAVRAVGGFDEYPVYEDWALFLAMQQNGATFGRADTSVYIASVRNTPMHRNRSMPIAERNKVHEQIVKDLGRS